jgi:hypothetical protein
VHFYGEDYQFLNATFEPLDLEDSIAPSHSALADILDCEAYFAPSSAPAFDDCLICLNALQLPVDDAPAGFVDSLVCLNCIPPSSAPPSRPCLRQFHRSCALAFLQESLSIPNLPPRCPACRAFIQAHTTSSSVALLSHQTSDNASGVTHSQ